MEDAEIGDIIRVSRFFWDSGAENLADPPVWGRVTKTRHNGGGCDFDYLCGGSSEFVDDMVRNNDLDAEGIPAFEGMDVWEVIPEDEVPDEIWAQIVQQALSK
jgi:hypothetical protein